MGGRVVFVTGEVVAGGVELPGPPRGAGPRLRVGPAPLRLLGLLERPLHRLHPALDLRAGVTRYVPDGLPALVDPPEGGPGRLQVLHRHQLLGLGGELLLELEVLALLGVPLREDLAAGGEEDVLGAAETVPQVVLGLALGAARRLPLGHQVAVARGGGHPVRGTGQRLGLGDQLLLGLAGVLALGVQRGEVRLAPLGERRAGVREAVPQLVVRLAVEAGETLPGVHQRPQPLTGRTPLLALCQLLRLGDQRHLGLLGLVGLLGLEDLALLAPRLDRRHERVEPLAQRVEVAHRVVLVDLLPQVVDGRRRVLRRQVGGLHPPFEEADLDHNAVVLALEIGQSLFGRTGLPRSDDLLALGRTHVHGARLVDAAPRVAAHSASST
ncbi:hypothetical protein Sgri01_06411 [Streptomyces griseus]